MAYTVGLNDINSVISRVSIAYYTYLSTFLYVVSLSSGPMASDRSKRPLGWMFDVSCIDVVVLVQVGFGNQYIEWGRLYMSVFIVVGVVVTVHHTQLNEI